MTVFEDLKENPKLSPDLDVLLRIWLEKLVETHFGFCFKKCELFEFLEFLLFFWISESGKSKQNMKWVTS